MLGPTESTGGKLAGMSGSHRPEGVFLVTTPGGASTRGGRCRAAIADMAPTILRLCGIDPPAGLDGRGLDGVAVPSSETETSKRDPLISEHPYDPAEEREISARLSALGYLE